MIKEDPMFTEQGKIKYPLYTLLLENSTNEKVDELPIEDVQEIAPVVDKNGKPSFMISFYDHEYCYNATLFCDHIEIEKKIIIL